MIVRFPSYLPTTKGDNICGRFNAISINICYKTYKSTKSPIVLQNQLANVQKNQTSLSNGTSEVILIQTTEVILIQTTMYQKRVIMTRLFFAKCCHLCTATRLNKTAV